MKSTTKGFGSRPDDRPFVKKKKTVKKYNEFAISVGLAHSNIMLLSIYILCKSSMAVSEDSHCN